MQLKHSLSLSIAHSIAMASDSELLAHGYEELCNVLQEMENIFDNANKDM